MPEYKNMVDTNSAIVGNIEKTPSHVTAHKVRIIANNANIIDRPVSYRRPEVIISARTKHTPSIAIPV